MPIFTPTQGQGALLPLRSPQLGAPTANPLNVLAPASVFQRNRALDQQNRALEIREREMLLREQIGVVNSQNQLFKSINDAFSLSNAQNVKKQKEFNNSTYGLNPEFFPEQVSEIDNAYNSSLQQALGTVGGVKDLSSVNQARTDLSRLLANTNRTVRNNTEYQSALADQTQYNKTVDGIDKLASQKGMVVNVRRQMELDDKMRARGRGDAILRPGDFNVDNYVFDANKGREAIRKTVETALGTVPFEHAQSDDFINDIASTALNSLVNDPNALGIAENLSVVSGMPAQEELLELIEDEIGPLRNNLKRTEEEALDDAEDEEESPFGETANARELNEIHEEVSSQGFEVNDLEKIRDIEAARDRARKKPNEVEPVEEIIDNGDLVFTQSGEEIARFPKPPEILTKEFTEDGVQFRNAEGDVINVPEQPALIPITEDVLQEEGVNIGLKGDNHSLSPKAIDLLKSIPPEFNTKDTIVTSSLREKEENESVGGVPGSHHLTGDAIDIRTKNKQGREFAEWLIETPEGNQWLIDNKYDAIWEDQGGENEHLHLQPVIDVPNVSDVPETADTLNPFLNLGRNR